MSYECVEQELEAFGFSNESASYLSIAFDLERPLSENIKNNIRLLKESVDLGSLDENQFTQVGFFLTRDFAENCFMASVPERYTFSEEQKDIYNHNPFYWYISYDLFAYLDDHLMKVISDEQERQDIYREMYLNGAWADIDTLKEICVRISGLPNTFCEKEHFVCKWWFILLCTPPRNDSRTAEVRHPDRRKQTPLPPVRQLENLVWGPA